MTSVFDGSWRPQYAPGPEELPDILSLADGIYECLSCAPPYRVVADGRDHAVVGHPRFETLSVTAVDDRAVRLIGRRGGAGPHQATMGVAPGGSTQNETPAAPVPRGG